MLNEGLAPRAILSEGLKHHLDAKKPLTEHLYRAGSTNYFNLWAEARSLYSREILEITHEDDLAVLTETDLGHFGMFEGKKVPLDFPIELTEDEAQKEANFILNKILQQLQNIDTENIQNSKDIIVALEKLDTSFIKALEKLDTSLDFVASAITGRDTLDISVDQDTYGKFASAKESLLKEIIVRVVEGKKVPLDFPMLDEGTYKEGGEDGRKYALLKVRPENYNLMIDKLQDMNINHTRHSGIEGVIKIYTDRIPDKVLYRLTHDVWVDKFVLKEAKNDNKKLNKPMRDSSGGKAYKVYVKDPKTKKIKTVRFGSGGLRAKINDKEARNAFAKRHKCSTKKDKTKAGYWSCRLPRYAKLLGLKSNFGGFW
jgi:hypothetical protein